MSLHGDNLHMPTSYSECWIQLVIPSATCSQAGLTSNCHTPTSAANLYLYLYFSRHGYFTLDRNWIFTWIESLIKFVKNINVCNIVHLHAVAHRYFTFTFLVLSLCSLSMFKTLYSVLNTCHFIKFFKTLHFSVILKC
jgi:hypothetical protein